MTTAVANKPAKKIRTPKRLTVDQLKNNAVEREKKPNHKGVKESNIQWDSLRFNDDLKRQVVTIKTVDENGKLDGNMREVATSDLQHIQHTEDLSKSLKSKHQNIKRAEKRKSK
jgi:hypothetical protein